MIWVLFFLPLTVYTGQKQSTSVVTDDQPQRTELKRSSELYGVSSVQLKPFTFQPEVACSVSSWIHTLMTSSITQAQVEMFYLLIYTYIIIHPWRPTVQMASTSTLQTDGTDGIHYTSTDQRPTAQTTSTTPLQTDGTDSSRNTSCPWSLPYLAILVRVPADQSSQFTSTQMPFLVAWWASKDIAWH